MISNRAVCWFDRFDYENMGMDDRWYIQKTAKMLTCFEMETKGYYTHDDLNTIYSKIHDKYQLFIKDAIYNGDLPYLTPNAANFAGYPGIDVSYVVHSETTSFLQNDFIESISKNNKIRIDIEKLKRYLAGEEAPVNTMYRISRPEEQSRIVIQATDEGADTAASNILSAKDLGGDKYCFEKTAQSWNLRFGYEILEGVKDLVGMDYIQVLLRNPGASIGVYQIQAMLNPIGIKAPEGKRKQELEIVEGHTTVADTSNNSKKHSDIRSSKSVSLDNLKKRLLEILQERNKLDEDCDYIDFERLDNECAKIEADIDNVRFANNDDPELKRNRDKVSKNIKAALNNIKDQEIAKGYNTAPLYNFLKIQIKSASECTYTPPIINPPQWSF